MISEGQALHLEQPPDIYLVDGNAHVIDKIGGRIVSHKIYPVHVVDQIEARARSLKAAASFIGRITRRKRGKKPKKGKRA